MQTLAKPRPIRCHFGAKYPIITAKPSEIIGFIKYFLFSFFWPETF